MHLEQGTQVSHSVMGILQCHTPFLRRHEGTRFDRDQLCRHHAVLLEVYHYLSACLISIWHALRKADEV